MYSDKTFQVLIYPFSDLEESKTVSKTGTLEKGMGGRGKSEAGMRGKEEKLQNQLC